MIRADRVNRSTYYYNYYELEEVLAKVVDITIEELTKKMEASIQDPEYYNVNNQILPSTLVLFEHIFEYKEYYASLLESDISSKFSEKFVAAVRHFNRNLEVTFINPPDVDIDYDMYANFYAYTAFGQVRYWLECGFRQTPAEMTEQLTHFIFMKVKSIKVV